MANVFELNTLDVLGGGFREFSSQIKSLSLTDAKTYFSMRSSLSASLCDTIISNLYKTIFRALTAGTRLNGDPLFRENGIVLGGAAGTGSLIPSYPSQKANILAMRICELLESELSEIVNTLLPLSFSTVANESLNFQPRANLLNPTTA